MKRCTIRSTFFEALAHFSGSGRAVSLLPERSNGPDPKIPLVFEMERIKLRWHIYQVDGIEEFLRRAERARGIL